MKKGFTLAVLLGLGACHEPATVDAVQKEQPATAWTQLQDGSQFAHARGENVNEAARCWPKGDGYDCISVMSVDFDSVGKRYIVRAAERKELGKASSPGIGDIDGYSCNYLGMIGATEEIVRGSDVLVSRRSGSGAPWSKSYVDGYLKDNGLPGRFFNCVDVLDAVRGGSLATLGTTSVKRTMLGA